MRVCLTYKWHITVRLARDGGQTRRATMLGGRNMRSRIFFVLIFAGIGLPQPTNLTKLKAVGSTPIRASEEIRRLTSLDHTAYALAMDGKYLQAQGLYQQVCDGARALGEMEWVGRCLTALGSCQFAMFQ